MFHARHNGQMRADAIGLQSHDLSDHCNLLKTAPKNLKNTPKGKTEEGLCGRKTRTDEQNGPYVSGRVEEYTRKGRRHSARVFFSFF